MKTPRPWKRPRARPRSRPIRNPTLAHWVYELLRYGHDAAANRTAAIVTKTLRSCQRNDLM